MGNDTDVTKSYYAIIPADVRYDSNLTPNAKLLYGEVTALCNEKGYCWASNSYFAKLYNVTTTSISHWVSALEKAGYITVELIYNGKEITARHIRLACSVEDKIIPDNSSSNSSSNIVKESSYVKEVKYKDEIKQIIDYLNKAVGSRYRYSSESTNKFIRARLNDGYSIDDFKEVINKKTSEWLNTDMAQYLRPATLFGNKFEQYLNQISNKPKFNPMRPTQTNISEDTSNESSGIMADSHGEIITY